MPETQPALPGGAIARQEPTALELIRELAVDARVDVTKLAALVELQERQEAREAEREFNRDFAAALLEMPRIAKNGKIDMGAKGSMRFARYEDIDAIVRGIESKYGFTRSFMTGPSDTGITVTVKLTHRSGHCERSSRHMPPDTGAGRNALQAIGSSSSYAKRYLTLDIWNLVTEDADDDGRRGGGTYISSQQRDQIEDMLTQIGYTPDRNPEGLARFLAMVGCKTVAEIPAACFKMAVAQLTAKARKA